MKRVLSILAVVAMAVATAAQQKPSSAVGGGRLFFPRNFIWGYSQFDIAPPHNEPDPNLCAANAADFGGRDAPCNAFARYMLSGYVEVRPFARTELRRLFFFGAPTFLFGKNLPHTLYTWSPDAIGWERSWGAGITIGRGFELRVTQHFLFQRFGCTRPFSRSRRLGDERTLGTIQRDWRPEILRPSGLRLSRTESAGDARRLRRKCKRRAPFGRLAMFERQYCNCAKQLWRTLAPVSDDGSATR